MRLLVVAQKDILSLALDCGAFVRTRMPGGHRPTCLAADHHAPGRVWCGTSGGVLRSDDSGQSWHAAGLTSEHVTSLAASPVRADRVWSGTRPSALWRTASAGRTWKNKRGLLDLPSAPEWSFPPKPRTHHVRWIACHPFEEGRLWLAIEAGALVTTPDGGESWRDRVAGGPWDTHELALHPEKPEVLRVAAGDGYFESEDGGATWSAPRDGLEVGYLRSVAIDPGDPDVVVASAASGPGSAYVAGKSDGRLYRRQGRGRWERVVAGWPDPPTTIAPLLVAGTHPGELWSADERGVHRSGDGGRRWERAAEFPKAPSSLRSLAVMMSPARNPSRSAG